MLRIKDISPTPDMDGHDAPGLLEVDRRGVQILGP